MRGWIRVWVLSAALVLLGLGGARGEEDYAQKLAGLLEKKDYGDSSKLISKLIKHAHSNEKHSTIPSVDEFVDKNDAPDDSSHVDLLHSKLDSNMARLKSSNVLKTAGDSIDRLTQELRKHTKDAVDHAESHAILVEDVESITYELVATLSTADKLAEKVKSKVELFSELVKEMTSATQEMTKNFQAVRMELDQSKKIVKETDGHSFKKSIWYFVILAQLFAFVLFVFYKRTKMNRKLNSL